MNKTEIIILVIISVVVSVFILIVMTPHMGNGDQEQESPVVSWEDKFRTCDIERKAMAAAMLEHSYRVQDKVNEIKEETGIYNGQ